MRHRASRPWESPLVSPAGAEVPASTEITSSAQREKGPPVCLADLQVQGAVRSVAVLRTATWGQHRGPCLRLGGTGSPGTRGGSGLGHQSHRQAQGSALFLGRLVTHVRSRGNVPWTPTHPLGVSEDSGFSCGWGGGLPSPPGSPGLPERKD